MTLTLGLDILLALLGVSMVLCFVRLYLGPNPPNRAVAFDTIAVQAVAMVALFAMRTDQPILMDVALVTAVLGFLGTVMLSRYLERSELRDWESDED
jgi:multisubunit Na+/H+ antiporter MnhF subunit